MGYFMKICKQLGSREYYNFEVNKYIHISDRYAHRVLVVSYFETFLEWCVQVVGERRSSAKGHFRHSGVTVEAI